MKGVGDIDEIVRQAQEEFGSMMGSMQFPVLNEFSTAVGVVLIVLIFLTMTPFWDRLEKMTLPLPVALVIGGAIAAYLVWAIVQILPWVFRPEYIWAFAVIAGIITAASLIPIALTALNNLYVHMIYSRRRKRSRGRR